MKENEEPNEEPFAVVLAEILNEEPLPIQQLYRLSDMAAEDWAAFVVGWSALADERRQVIVRHLADISEDNFVVNFAPVFVHCLIDELPNVRRAALDGLWDSTDIKLIPTITQLMQTDESEDVQTAAAAALGHYLLLAEWGQLPERILPDLIETLLAEYDKEETAVSIRRALLEALGAAGHPRVNQLIEEAYENNDPMMQLSAVFAMGNSADRRWAGTVMDEMESPYEEMRAEAARAAGNIGSSDFVPELADLAYDEDLTIRMAAIIALGQIGGDEVQQILANMLDDSEVKELEQVLEAVEDALEESALMAGDFNFADFPFNDDE
ncbi:MAG: HEAT repeat domain-containing protein [Chloroflexi bacterium]|nr:HEAT repeat domain-containing protein [Chloroflexota bacterium]